jgi:hypothetical protein
MVRTPVPRREGCTTRPSGERFLCTERGTSYSLHKKLMVMLMDLAPALLPS